ncbi:hypothetical protein [Nocardia nepalensis]|uniref:hypothetical protein n=1 Tax=Nocardia nepalensis TaxID=3375448 RepID=UPI003B6739EB
MERSHARIRARREEAREKERTIADAVKRYLNHWQAITAREAERDQEVEALRLQISVVESRAAEDIARLRADQARAAALIRDQGQSDDDVAELLEISTKHARQLINAGRATGSTTSPNVPLKSATTLTQQPHRDAPGVDLNPVPEKLAGEGAEPADAVETSGRGRLTEPSPDDPV